jgi:hypothetical protein
MQYYIASRRKETSYTQKMKEGYVDHSHLAQEMASNVQY